MDIEAGRYPTHSSSTPTRSPGTLTYSSGTLTHSADTPIHSSGTSNHSPVTLILLQMSCNRDEEFDARQSDSIGIVRLFINMDTTQVHGKIKLGSAIPVQDLKAIRKPHPIWQGSRTCKDQDGKLYIICNFPGCAQLFKHPHLQQCCTIIMRLSSPMQRNSKSTTPKRRLCRTLQIFQGEEDEEASESAATPVPMPTSFNGLKDVLFVRYEEFLQKVVQITSGYKFAPSLTIDIWSDPASSYLGGNHLPFLRTRWKPATSVFGIEEVEGSKTASKVRRITEEMLKPFQLEVGDLSIDFPHRLPCFAHRANTAMEKGLRELMASSSFKSMAKIITSVRQSPQALGMLRQLTGKGLTSHSTTRWAYWPEVISRFLDQYPAIIEVDRRLEKRWCMLEPTELDYLQDSLLLLEPFVEALSQIQAEQSVTISMAYPFVQALLLSVRNTKEEGPPTIKSLAIALENELDRVFAHMLHYNTINYEPVYIMATALDPNYAKVLEEVDVDRACISIASMLRSEVETEVAKLALSAFTVPASSSPIERVFSWAGMASNKLRNRVKRKTLNAQLFVDLNRKFVD
uniref:HAT C-terminal dimerisation domain-containing protein n=1 Tax=Ditylenchus dipsaci TaxID=166011 RepID=A0A915CSI5_9BILA